MRSIVFTTLLLLYPGATAAATCAGADPAIVSVAVKGVTPSNGLNQYKIGVTVTNLGSSAQASNVLQYVDIYQKAGEKLDAKGIPPLRPGQSYSFTYVAQRSSDAGNGTTKLSFKLDMRQPSAPSSQDCDLSNDTRTVTF